MRHVPMGLRVLGLALLVVAFARPQTAHHEEEALTEGIEQGYLTETEKTWAQFYPVYVLPRDPIQRLVEVCERIATYFGDSGLSTFLPIADREFQAAIKAVQEVLP